MKKITFVYPQMVMGGAEKVLIRLIEKIDREKYIVNVVLMKHGGELEHSFPNDVETSYSTSLSPFLNLKQGHIGKTLLGIYFRIKIRTSKSYEKKSYYSYLAQEWHGDISKDCAICFSHYNFLSICSVAFSEAKTKILWVHLSFRENLDKKMYIKVLNRFDYVFCVSKAVKDEFDRIFPMYSEKSQVVYNLIDKEMIINLSNKTVNETFKPISLLTIARLSKEKGQIMIPRIVRRLLDNDYCVYWYLIGDGKIKQEIYNEILINHVENNVILLGTKKNPFPYLKQCDIYVQPTYMEGFCTTTNEARVLCKPVVTTDIPPMREQFVNGINGILTDCNEEDIYTGIKKLLDCPDLLKQFSEKLSEIQFDNNVELQKLYSSIDK